MSEVDDAYGKVEAVVEVAVKYPAMASFPSVDVPSTDRVAQGEVVPIPRLPEESRRMNSVREPGVFLFEKVRADAGDEVETLVRSEAILAVVVAVVVAPAPEQSAREQKVEELKRIPVPIPEEDEVVAR